MSECFTWVAEIEWSRTFRSWPASATTCYNATSCYSSLYVVCCTHLKPLFLMSATRAWIHAQAFWSEVPLPSPSNCWLGKMPIKLTSQAWSSAMVAFPGRISYHSDAISRYHS